MTVRDESAEPEIELPAGGKDGTSKTGNDGETEHQTANDEEKIEANDAEEGQSISVQGNGLTAAAFEQEEENEEDFSERFRFPKPFYDPSTMMVMKDPEVGPDGNSAEKPSLDADIPIVYYPNRALKTIIQKEVQLASPSLVGSLRRIDDAVWKSWNKIVDKSVIGGDMKPLPESFYCPITSEIMSDPVITPNGHTFERVAIEHWVSANGTNPVSRDPLHLNKLRRNNNLYDLIQIEKSKMDPVSHPSIRRWKATTEDTSRRGELNYDDEETQGAAGIPSAPPENMPTTYDEIAATWRYRRRQDANTKSCLVIFVFTVLVVMGVIPFGVALFFLLCIIFCISCSLSRLDSQG